jgi:hypothetical protein
MNNELITLAIIVEFPNGYQASVISDGCGSESGKYEIAVMYKGSIDYSTPVTEDVLGNLTEQDVLDVCKQISMLPVKEVTH